MSVSSFYSPNPKNVPGDLSALTGSYKIRAGLAVFSILLFFLLYFSMIAVFGYLVHFAFFYPVYQIGNLTGMLLVKIGMVLGALALFIFSLKFLFKIRNTKPKNRILLDKKEYPHIFEYVHQICKETGAPKPGKIFIDTDINAYVSYSNIWLSLLFPVRKNLTIGAGLLHVLNLSEFKAVMAHEFGHFAQRSMRIGSYIHSANIIVHDLIFTRDAFDEALAKWRASDIRFSAAAWIISPVIWIIRQLLYLFYMLLNILHSSLSREMEFNADKTAVKLAGSESIISALWKLEFAVKDWNETLTIAYSTSQHGKLVKNIYRHFNKFHDSHSNERKKQYEDLEIDKDGHKIYFKNEEFSKVNMYSSHPPNKLREKSAKSPYVECEKDERSPGLLLSDSDIIFEKLTQLVYLESLNVKSNSKFISDEEFEVFIKNETFGKELLLEYDNTFEIRYLQIPPIEEIGSVYLYEPGAFETKEQELRKQLKSLNLKLEEYNDKIRELQQLAEGTYKLTYIEYKGKKFAKHELQTAFELISSDRNSYLMDGFLEWDKQFISLYHSGAKIVGNYSGLERLYLQHSQFVSFYKMFMETKNFVITEFNRLRQLDSVTVPIIHEFSGVVNGKMDRLNEMLESLLKLDFIPLPNISNSEDLKVAIVGNGKFPRSSRNIFESGDFDKLMNFLENVNMHLQRVDIKSIIKILSVHHEVKFQFLKRI